MPETFIGKVKFVSTAAKPVFTLDADSSFVQLVQHVSPTLNAMQLTNTGSLSLYGSGNDFGARLDGSIATLFLGQKGKGGQAFLRDANGADGIFMDGANGTIILGTMSNAGELLVRNSGGVNAIILRSSTAQVEVGAKNNAGEVIVRDGTGKETVRLDGGAGDIILANADCAEEFDCAAPDDVEPGTVMVLGAEGELEESSLAYDRRVAGIVSGAGEFRPGIVLDRRDTPRRRLPVALVGKTYCKVDATDAAVQVGDLLTTSAVPGHAMKAADPLRAFGAVIGKALRPLAGERGLIPVLVALQ